VSAQDNQNGFSFLVLIIMEVISVTPVSIFMVIMEF
jgi:hypothetical protein